MIEQMSSTIKKHSAGGLLIVEGKVLLIHWDSPRDSYDFPKGTVEKNESPESACIREVKEETGYGTKIIQYIGRTRYDYDWVDGTHHDKAVDYFLLELDNGSVSTPQREVHETFQNKWVSTSMALKTLTRDIDKAILVKALELTGETI